MNRYTAKEAALKIKERGYDISDRTINYYAFEKKMFSVEPGKNCFTELEIDKIESILLLKQNAGMSLDEIKSKINEPNFNLQDIVEYCANNTLNLTQSYYSRSGGSQPVSVSYGLRSVNDINLSIPQMSYVEGTNARLNRVQSINPSPDTASFVKSSTCVLPDSALRIREMNKIYHPGQQTTTLKINDQITLLTNGSIPDEKLKKIIQNIKSILER